MDHELMFGFFSKELCQKADGIIYIYDITNYNSFKHIPNYIKKVSSDAKKILMKCWWEINVMKKKKKGK